MNTKHTPSIVLSAAQRRYMMAQEKCPHWDFAGIREPVNGLRPCCYELDDAERAYRSAIRSSKGKARPV